MKNNKKLFEISNLPTDNPSSLIGNADNSNIELVPYSIRSISPMLEIRNNENFEVKQKPISDQNKG